MNEQQTRELLEDFVHCLNNRDIDRLVNMTHDDYIEEYPQSGERIRGKQNFRKVYENFKNLPEVKAYNIHVSGNLGILEMLLDYPDGGIYNACEILSLKDGKFASSTVYFGKPFDAADWRSEWVEMMGDPTSKKGYQSTPSSRA